VTLEEVNNTMAYWHEEQPEVLETEKNVLRWFPRAGKLQVALPYWFDTQGMKHPGKTVTLDVEALQLSQDRERAVGILQEVLADLDAEPDPAA